MNTEHTATILNAKTRFPNHGIIKRKCGSKVLVFPFLRATWEVALANQPGTRATLRDQLDLSVFQDRWNKVILVLNKITKLENVILGFDSDEAEPGVRPEKHWEYVNAWSELPCWIDLFFVYTRLLADATAVALSFLVCNAPRSFPKDAKRLFLNSNWMRHCKMRVNANVLEEAIKEHREWFSLICSQDSNKSLRDSIVHRMSRWQVYVAHGDMRGMLLGTNTDLPRDDPFASIETIMRGFFSFLSALPPESWLAREFKTSDLVFGDSRSTMGGRFLPVLPINLDDD